MSIPKLIPADIDFMARTIYGEGRGEGQRSRVAIGHVLLNRWRSTTGQWAKDDTLSTACLRHWQFSAWNAGDPNMDKMMAVTVNNKVFRECMVAALTALNSPDVTKGARHYHTVSMGWPRAWGAKKEPCCVIGKHAFYNNVK